jgi:O-succinylbenzoic acid--CoA ligase
MANTESRKDELPSTWLLRAADRHGQRPALINGSTEVAYGALLEQTARLAGFAVGQGMASGTPFAVASHDVDRVARAIHLALYSGSALWPLDPRRPEQRAGLEEAGIPFALVDQGISMPDGIRCLPSGLLTAPTTDQAAPATSVPSSRIQLIVSTSGSTATPRGVMLTAGNLAAAVRASRRRIALAAGDVWLACLPLHHVAGISILLRCLEAGASVVLQNRFDVDSVWSNLVAHEVTHLSLVPAMLEALLEQRGGPPSRSLRVLLLGGGPIRESLVRRALDAGWPVCPTYGLTENASQVATLCAAPRDWHAGDMGVPLDGVHVEIVDPSGRPMVGRGRIRISGPTVMAGYLNATWSAGDGVSDGGFTTSDLGHVDERGRLHVLGRVDDVIVSGGENIMPQQLEGIIDGCDGVADIGVVGVPDPRWGERVVAVFTGDIDSLALERWCRDKLPSPLRPRGFLKLEALPRNPMGKLDRRALRRRAQEELKR